MVVDFSKIDLREPPMLILKNTTDVPIGVLGYAMNITADIKYDEASVIEFNLPAQVDGEPTPYYDAVIGMRIVELQNIGQLVLVNPKETGDGVKKTKACKDSKRLWLAEPDNIDGTVFALGVPVTSLKPQFRT